MVKPSLIKYASLIVVFIFFQLSVIVLHSKANENKIEFGINGGLTISTVKSNKLSGDIDFSKGINTGIGVAYLINKFVITTDLELYQNGYMNSNKSILSLPDEGEFEKSYIGRENIYIQYYIKNSWTVGYCIGKRINFIPHLGIYGSLISYCKNKAKSYIYIDPGDAEIIQDPLIPGAGYHETKSAGKVSL